MNKAQSNTILIKNISYLKTHPDKALLTSASLLIKNKRIVAINPRAQKADYIIEGRGMVVVPGFINTHHHFFQCGLRNLPNLQNQPIEKWVKTVCDAVKNMKSEDFYNTALANMAELLLYGCTTSTDMAYLVPKNDNQIFTAIIKAAHDIGVRLHLYRGSMSLSQKDGALFPDDVAQNSEQIIQSSEELIQKHHDNKSLAMIQIGLAPATLYTSKEEDFKNAVELAQKYKVLLQTHLAESKSEYEYTQKHYQQNPLGYLQKLGWEGPHVSFVHCINLRPEEILKLAHTHTNVVHCPISNARQPRGEVGVAPIVKMLEGGVNVALGVDGSAGNDSSNMLEELRWARTLQGIPRGSTYLSFKDTFTMGTLNGAKLLNRSHELGSIEVGKAADIALFKIDDKVEYAGANDPLGTLFATQATRAHTVIVNGKIVVQNSQLQTLKEQKIIDKLRKGNT